MTYKLTQSTSVIRIKDGAIIPADPENTDYQAYQEWLALGNVADPADATPSPSALSQIAQLESATLLPRVTREFMLTFFATQAAAAGTDPMTSPAFSKLKALDDQIAALRRLIA